MVLKLKDGKDELERVYAFHPEQKEEKIVFYGEKEVDLQKLKTAKRDAKGTKQR